MSLRLLRLPLAIGAPAPRLQLAAPRLAWAGRVMQATWTPRFEAVRAALLAVELEQLAQGAISASAVDCLAGDVSALTALLRPRELAAIPLGAYAAAPPDSADPAAVVLNYRFALVRRERLPLLVEALAADDLERLLQLAAFPACCRAALVRALAAGEDLPLAIHAHGAASAAGPASWDSPAFSAAGAASGSGPASAASSALAAGPAAAVNAAASPIEANALLQPLGIAAVAHVPCSAACTASQALGCERLERGSAAGHAQAMAHLRAALAWPASYSQRNGIAEVQTAALRLVQESARREPQLTYRWHPAAAASIAAGGGADAAVADRTADTGSASPIAAGHSAGVAAIAADTDLDNPAAADYGFASLHAWRMRQAAVVWEQSRRLRGGGSFIDLACGDGYLLQLVEAETRRLSVFGLDRSEAQIARAQRRLPHRSLCLRHGDIAGLAAQAPAGGYDFALLRPEDLLPLPEPERRHSLRTVFGAARQVLAYASDQALRRHGSLGGLLTAAGLAATRTPAAADISAEVQPLP
ncbi:class I SAM-dependent methyltransferase [Tahibacter harae]|uniref:Class I SAM-dependent methyltransferase n=1 Tax=Tahibacter harae TaxID=2963937 RepID=A0ABT1QTC8_9GAMM|nr:class I SAM-dependent methyltransferase [Tahibacter harae]MCQ4165548.1 class I SAM-dependent methyltransferase [Tahibacter harae]